MTSPSVGRGQTREERWEQVVAGRYSSFSNPGRDKVRDCMALADSEQSDLRSRLAAAEADRDKWARAADRRWRAGVKAAKEIARLRDGIQALAEIADDPRPGWAATERKAEFQGCGYVTASSLRSLLSPANPQKGEETS